MSIYLTNERKTGSRNASKLSGYSIGSNVWLSNCFKQLGKVSVERLMVKFNIEAAVFPAW
jgi:hypothetical protein